MELPDPPSNSFASDNASGVSPEVMAALAAANQGPALAYGQDAWTADAVAAMRALFDAPVEVMACWGGTGANVVALASVLAPWQSVLCCDTAHIVVDEAGAPGHFSGATVTPVAQEDGKLRPAAIEPFLGWLGVEHHPQPRVLSITQVTEMGTVYDTDEIAELCELAHRHDMVVHVDGARIANAVASTQVPVTEMLRDTGVDVVSFGLTKNGAMYGEAVVYLRPELARNAQYVRKQAGQLSSKTRFVSAQISALLTNDLWLQNARHANAMAAGLAERVAHISGVVVPQHPVANSVFARLPEDKIAPLQEWSFFWPWDPAQSLVRWMTSYATTTDDIERFAQGIEAVLDS